MIKMEKLSVNLSELMPFIKERLEAGQSVSFCPNGISMLPMLKEGRDAVTLSPATFPLRKYDLILYIRDNGTYVLHRIVKTGEYYSCIGDNQFITEEDIRNDQIIAVVSSFNRKGREYSVKTPVYLFYCRFWHLTRFPRRCFRAIKRRIVRFIKK